MKKGRSAKEKRIRLWQDFVGKEKTNASEFDAQVMLLWSSRACIVYSYYLSNRLSKS